MCAELREPAQGIEAAQQWQERRLDRMVMAVKVKAQ